MVVMEEGEQRGICRKHTLDSQERYFAKITKSERGNKCNLM